MKTDTDTDLDKWFQGLQDQDRAAAPAFESLLARAPAARASARKSRSRGAPAWAAGGFALLATAGLFLILQRPANVPDASTVALPAWQSPTDFLLASPDNSLRRLSWTPTPTSGLDQPTLIRTQENR